MVGTYSALEIAASGLTAERVRMTTIASNLANARTTRTAEGGPYMRRDPVFRAVPVDASDRIGLSASAVKVARIEVDTRPAQRVYEPGHPDADARGYVEYPNVNVVEEMVNMIMASRAYEAGIASIESVKAMARSATGIGR
jgi:flagellar basal-body rod protein FlgC